ncbi:hypothetical protein ACFQE6_17620 [Natrinema soli]|uniref:Uncharacterized protein n=1 Tax=Natrinema soli TaxID=1930624 RepID=A0ABD5SU10_9EURY
MTPTRRNTSRLEGGVDDSSQREADEKPPISPFTLEFDRPSVQNRPRLDGRL